MYVYIYIHIYIAPSGRSPGRRTAASARPGAQGGVIITASKHTTTDNTDT